MRALVSAVIVTYNGARLICKCLASMSLQTYSNIETIIVDNGSTDNTLELVSRHFPQSHAIALGRNEEYCRGNNVGIAQSRGKYVLILNQDVQLEPTFVAEMVRAMETDPSVGIAGGKLLRSNAEGQPISPAIIDNAGGHVLLRNYVTRDRGYGKQDVGQYDVPEFVLSVSGAAALFRRSALESVRYQDQYFDEAFVAYKEDVDISWRCRSLGWRIRYVPSAVGYHVRGWAGPVASIAFRKHVSPERRRHSFKNRYLLILKNESTHNLVASLPWIAWYELRAFAFALTMEPHLLLTIPRLIALTPDVLRKRKHLMRRRRTCRVDRFLRAEA